MGSCIRIWHFKGNLYCVRPAISEEHFVQYLKPFLKDLITHRPPHNEIKFLKTI